MPPQFQEGSDQRPNRLPPPVEIAHAPLAPFGGSVFAVQCPGVVSDLPGACPVIGDLKLAEDSLALLRAAGK